MRVQVMTHPKNPPDAKGKVKSIDWNNSSDRKWLANHMHWAMCNEHMIMLSPESNPVEGNAKCQQS